MDGFTHPKATYPTPNFPYAYVPQEETVPDRTLAKTFTLGDRMFQSNTGPSFVAHQYLIAGQSADADENPVNNANGDVAGIWGCDSAPTVTVRSSGPNGTDLAGPYPCFDYQTMADILDAKGVTWKYYAPAIGKSGSIWSAFDAIHHIRFGADWASNIVSPNTQVLTDIQAGNLVQTTLIVPPSVSPTTPVRDSPLKGRTGSPRSP